MSAPEHIIETIMQIANESQRNGEVLTKKLRELDPAISQYIKDNTTSVLYELNAKKYYWVSTYIAEYVRTLK